MSIEENNNKKFDLYNGYQIDNTYYKKHFTTDEIRLRNKIITTKTGKETAKIWFELQNPDKVRLKNGKFKLDRPLTDEELIQVQRTLCKIDRIFLAITCMDDGSREAFTKILTHQFLYERCREVERLPDGHLDLWPRGHYKSTIVTIFGSMQEMLINPYITILLLTYTNKFAVEVIAAIKKTFQYCEKLKKLFPDLLYDNPEREAPANTWVKDKIFLKPVAESGRFATMTYSSVANPKTGHHAAILLFDDIVTDKSVTTQENRDKSKKMIDGSFSMGNMGQSVNRKQFVGTRYHKEDAYKSLINSGQVIERKYTATENGKMDGKLVFMDQHTWDTQWKIQDSYIVACQMLMNPTESDESIFFVENLRPFNVIKPMHIFIMVDPASSKKKKSDYTSMSVIGVYNDGKNIKKYLLDGVKDKLNLQERWEKLKYLHEKWYNYLRVYGQSKYSINVYYEQVSMQSDIESFKILMDHDGVHFDINPIRSNKDKGLRIKRLIMDFKGHTFLIPAYVWKNNEYSEWQVYNQYGNNSIHYSRLKSQKLFPNLEEYEKLNYIDTDFFLTQNICYPLKKQNHEGIWYDYTVEFIDQYENYPFVDHDDILDSISLLYDVPDLYQFVTTKLKVYY